MIAFSDSGRSGVSGNLRKTDYSAASSICKMMRHSDNNSSEYNKESGEVVSFSHLTPTAVAAAAVASQQK